MKQEGFEFIPDEEVPEEFPRVKHWLNAEMFERDVEHPSGESMTVPDQSMSMREILSRFARGLPINAGLRTNAHYDEFAEFPDTSNMDLADVQALRYQYEQELHEVNKRIREKKEKESAEKRRKLNEEMFERMKKEKEVQDDQKAKNVSGK